MFSSRQLLCASISLNEFRNAIAPQAAKISSRSDRFLPMLLILIDAVLLGVVL